MFALDYRRAENGCFIKTRAVASGINASAKTYGGEWINMVSNFNLTWKSACLEILNYVRRPCSLCACAKA